MGPVDPSNASRSGVPTEFSFLRPQMGRLESRFKAPQLLHRIENAEGDSLHDIRGELREATRGALWEADSREEAGTLVGNAIRDVLVDNGFDVDEVLEAVESRAGNGRFGRRGFGPFGLGALEYAEPLPESAVAEEPELTTVLEFSLFAQVTTVVRTEPIDVVDAEELDGVDVDDMDQVDDMDHVAFKGSLEFEFELRIETPTRTFELSLELSGPLPPPESDEGGFEGARRILDAFFSRFSPGSLVSTEA